MKVLIVGSGGREHALAWKIAQSQRVSEVLVAPGNAGTAAEPNMCNVNLSADDSSAVVGYCQENDIGLVVVGPEAPLAAGLVDALEDAQMRWRML